MNFKERNDIMFKVDMKPPALPQVDYKVSFTAAKNGVVVAQYLNIDGYQMSGQTEPDNHFFVTIFRGSEEVAVLDSEYYDSMSFGFSNIYSKVDGKYSAALQELIKDRGFRLI